MRFFIPIVSLAEPWLLSMGTLINTSESMISLCTCWFFIFTPFGVSGHLYNHNLVPYDRATESYWSQMGLQSIKGSLGGNPLETKSLLLTTALTAKESFPQAMIVYDSLNHICDSICLNPETKSGHENVSSLFPTAEGPVLAMNT